MFFAKLNEAVTSRKSFISDRLNALSLGVALLINIIHWGLLLYKIKPSDSSILLHYNVIYGPDLVDKSSYAYLVPLIALIMFAINFAIGLYFYKREKLASYFLNFFGIPVQLIFLAASIVVILVNE